MKKAIAVFTVLLLVSSAAAQAENLGPGMIDASSPFYGLEVALDNAAVSFGMANASKVALERAVEAQAAVEKNDSRAVQRAVGQFNAMAERRNLTGISQAESVLQGVMENAPAEAQQGLQTAMENIQKARERARGPEAGNGAPGPGMNGSMPDMNNTVPNAEDSTNTTDNPDEPVSSNPGQNATQ